MQAPTGSEYCRSPSNIGSSHDPGLEWECSWREVWGGQLGSGFVLTLEPPLAKEKGQVGSSFSCCFCQHRKDKLVPLRRLPRKCKIQGLPCSWAVAEQAVTLRGCWVHNAELLLRRGIVFLTSVSLLQKPGSWWGDWNVFPHCCLSHALHSPISAPRTEWEIRLISWLSWGPAAPHLHKVHAWTGRTPVCEQQHAFWALGHLGHLLGQCCPLLVKRDEETDPRQVWNFPPVVVGVRSCFVIALFTRDGVQILLALANAVLTAYGTQWASAVNYYLNNYFLKNKTEH